MKLAKSVTVWTFLISHIFFDIFKPRNTGTVHVSRSESLGL